MTIVAPVRVDSTQATTAEDQRGPGVLRGEVWLSIQTWQAQMLVRGRNGSADKPAITGLVGFAAQLRVIWQAARSDDPYADWWLIKVHETMDTACQLISERQLVLDALLNQMTAMDIAVAESSRPYRFPLRFSNPYAYRGAQMISAYDTLVRTVLTCSHVGVFDRDTSEGTLKPCARKIRGVFALPQGYRFLGIDRNAVLTGTDTAARAIELMGIVPEDVMSGTRRAPLVPRNAQLLKEPRGQSALTPISRAESTGSKSKNDGG